MAKRKKVVLPRLTLLAYSRRDLVAFTSAVEALRCITTDLRQLVEDLGRTAAVRKSRAVKQKAVALVEPIDQVAADVMAMLPPRPRREGGTDGS